MRHLPPPRGPAPAGRERAEAVRAWRVDAGLMARLWPGYERLEPDEQSALEDVYYLASRRQQRLMRQAAAGRR